MHIERWFHSQFWLRMVMSCQFVNTQVLLLHHTQRYGGNIWGKVKQRNEVDLRMKTGIKSLNLAPWRGFRHGFHAVIHWIRHSSSLQCLWKIQFAPLKRVGIVVRMVWFPFVCYFPTICCSSMQFQQYYIANSPVWHHNVETSLSIFVSGDVL